MKDDFPHNGGSSSKKTGSGSLAASNLSDRYLWGATVDQILADGQVTSLGTAGTNLWGLADHEGTIRDIVNDSGSVVDHRVFDGFGKVTSEERSGHRLCLRLCGRVLGRCDRHEPDGPAGVRSVGGAWASRDPLGLAAGPNPYAYCGNSPMTHIDPMGLCEENGGGGDMGEPWLPGPGPFANGNPDLDPNDPNNWGEIGPIGPTDRYGNPLPGSNNPPHRYDPSAHPIRPIGGAIHRYGQHRDCPALVSSWHPACRRWRRVAAPDRRPAERSSRTAPWRRRQSRRFHAACYLSRRQRKPAHGRAAPERAGVWRFEPCQVRCLTIRPCCVLASRTIGISIAWLGTMSKPAR